MLADTGAAGHHPDVDQIEIPEAAQLCFSLYGNVEGIPQLDRPVHARGSWGLVGGFDGVGDVFGSRNLGAEKVKQFLRLRVDAA